MTIVKMSDVMADTKIVDGCKSGSTSGSTQPPSSKQSPGQFTMPSRQKCSEMQNSSLGSSIDSESDSSDSSNKDGGGGGKQLRRSFVHSKMKIKLIKYFFVNKNFKN